MNRPRPLSLRSLIATAVVALAASTTLAFSRPATIEINGQRLPSDIPPVTTGKQAFLPLRAVTAGLGARVSYNRKTRTILVVRGADRLRLRIGATWAILDGKTIKLSHAPFTVRGRTMVAANTIERALGSRVRYNPGKSTIDVSTPDASVAAEGRQNSSSQAF